MKPFICAIFGTTAALTLGYGLKSAGIDIGQIGFGSLGFICTMIVIGALS